MHFLGLEHFILGQDKALMRSMYHFVAETLFLAFLDTAYPTVANVLSSEWSPIFQ